VLVHRTLCTARLEAQISALLGVRDELLNARRFDSLLEARVIIEEWRCDYNDNSLINA
jgi:hypothetical protein